MTRKSETLSSLYQIFNTVICSLRSRSIRFRSSDVRQSPRLRWSCCFSMGVDIWIAHGTGHINVRLVLLFSYKRSSPWHCRLSWKLVERRARARVELFSYSLTGGASMATAVKPSLLLSDTWMISSTNLRTVSVHIRLDSLWLIFDSGRTGFCISHSRWHVLCNKKCCSSRTCCNMVLDYRMV